MRYILGGGGGSALWAMFGGFDNLGKLVDLMGNSAVREAAEMFADLVDKNPEAFENMGKEEMQQILERIAEAPEDAKEIMKDLNEEKAKMAEEAKKENLEEQEPQLKKDQVMEAFQQAKGSPQNQEQVFGNLAGNMLQELLSSQDSSSSSYFGEFDAKKQAKSAIKKYLEEIKKKKGRATKTAKAYNDFFEALGGDEETLIKELSELANEAYWSVPKTTRTIDSLKEKFETFMENKLTEPLGDGEDESNAITIRGMVQVPARK